MSRTNPTGDVLELGAVPRVHLLPAEVIAQRKAKGLRQRLLTILVGVVVLVGVAVGVASLGLASATSEETLEQTHSAALLAQAATFSSVTDIQNQLDDINRLQPAVTSNEILWSDFVASVATTLPSGTSITAFSAALEPIVATPETDPLKGKHVATLNITALGPQSSVSDWLARLLSVPGVVDATPGDVALSATPGLYIVKVELLISTDVLANRFAGK
jgi:hypothetical protein